MLALPPAEGEKGRSSVFHSQAVMKATKPRRQGSGRITAEDVARVLGVSQSTISRAFTATASISDDMRQRVVSAAMELGYQPNIIARSLMTRRTNIVAIVVGNLIDPFTRRYCVC